MGKKGKYFSRFPLVRVNRGGLEVRDILRRLAPREVAMEDSSLFNRDIVRSGDRPEGLATYWYDSPHYHWVIMYANGIRDLWNDWPLDDWQFEEALREKYPGKSLILERRQFVFSPITASIDEEDVVLVNGQEVDDWELGTGDQLTVVLDSENHEWETSTFVASSLAYGANASVAVEIPPSSWNVSKVTFAEGEHCSSPTKWRGSVHSWDSSDEILTISGWHGYAVESSWASKSDGTPFRVYTSVDAIDSPAFWVDSELDAVQRQFASSDLVLASGEGPITKREMEEDDRFERSGIQVLKPEHLVAFVSEFEELVSATSNDIGEED